MRPLDAHKLSGMSYKRNQIEEAIARILEPTSQKPTSELRTRIKRLLQLDRAFGRKPRSSGAEEANFAFSARTHRVPARIFHLRNTKPSPL